MGRTTFVILTLFAGVTAWAEPVELLPNQDFEQTPLDWSLWPAESKTTYERDTTVAYHGDASLKVTALNSGDRAFILASTEAYQPNTVYRISVMVRKDAQVPDSAIGYTINWRAIDGGAILDRSSPHDLTITRDGDWSRWSGLVMSPGEPMSMQFLLGVQYTVGRVWFDRIVIDEVGGPDQLQVDVWTNLTLGVEIGGGPLSRFIKHQTEEDAIYRAARRYNALLMDSALAEHELREAERCLAYTGTPPAEPRVLFEQAEMDLNDTYLAYGAAFRQGNEADWTKFEQAADSLAASLAALRQSVATALAGRPAAGPLPAHLGRQPREVPALTPGGKLNRLLFGCWSPTQFVEFERPFELEFHSSAPGTPKTHTPTEIDFSNITERCDALEELGYRGTFAYLPFGIHEYLYAPAWLLERHQNDIDFFKLSADGEHGPSRGSDHSLNWHHPAVREHIRDYLTQYAKFAKNEPRILFYEVDQEAYPYFSTPKGRRETGYGPHAEADFRAWLQRKYGSITKLNQAWNTIYADFAGIQPPPDAFIEPEREVGPLVAEFEAWRDESYEGYLKLIYDSLKAADPSKPVVARHSALLNGINGANLFETCDVLSYHRGDPQMQMMNVYLNTLNRYHGKGLGYMEDFWGTQEESNRVADEVAQRRGLERHISRVTTWGRTLQMKWYSYTTGSYIFTYNGNWMNPRYDITTMRYCAPALAVAKRQMEQFDWILTHSEIAPSKVVVLQPSASMRNGRPGSDVFSELLGVHELLYRNGQLYELVPEEYIEDGREPLTHANVVILPRAIYLSANLQDKLAAFLTRGGTILALGKPGERDELARPSVKLLAAVRAGGGDVAALEAVWARAVPGEPLTGAAFGGVGVGDGRFIAGVPTGWLGDPIARQAVVQLISGRAGNEAFSAERKLEVVLRLAEDGGRYLFVLNPDPDHEATDQILIADPVETAVDLAIDGGWPVPVREVEGYDAVTVRLGPCESTVIELR